MEYQHRTPASHSGTASNKSGERNSGHLDGVSFFERKIKKSVK